MIISTAALPLSNYVRHAHWGKIVWVPFRDRSLPSFWWDAGANVLLYAPFGFLGVRCRVRKNTMAILAVIGVAALLSATGEFFQIYCHNRFPTATDVSTNTLGAALGALLNRIYPISRPQS